MSQTDLSDATGINQANISQIERGERSPSDSNIEGLARALDLPLNDLIVERQMDAVAGLTPDQQAALLDRLQQKISD